MSFLSKIFGGGEEAPKPGQEEQQQGEIPPVEGTPTNAASEMPETSAPVEAAPTAPEEAATEAPAEPTPAAPDATVEKKDEVPQPKE